MNGKILTKKNKKKHHKLRKQEIANMLNPKRTGIPMKDNLEEPQECKIQKVHCK